MYGIDVDGPVSRFKQFRLSFFIKVLDFMWKRTDAKTRDFRKDWGPANYSVFGNGEG